MDLSRQELESVHEGDRDTLLDVIFEQTQELGDLGHKVLVTCPCGIKVSLFRARQCHYCEIYLCPDCADEHFGEEP